MERQVRLDRIVPGYLFFVIARGDQPRPFRALEIGREWHVADGVAVIDENRRQVILVEQLLLVVAEDDQRVEFGATRTLLQPFDRRLGLVVARGKALRRQFRQRSRGGAAQQFLVVAGSPSLSRNSRTPSRSIKLGQSLAGAFSIGVCDVATPRTILAMTLALRCICRRGGAAKWYGRPPSASTSVGVAHVGCRQNQKICRSVLGRRGRPDLGRIHQDPKQIAVLRPGLGGARLHG